jgi:hypothetical protein
MSGQVAHARELLESRLAGDPRWQAAPADTRERWALYVARPRWPRRRERRADDIAAWVARSRVVTPPQRGRLIGAVLGGLFASSDGAPPLP